MMRLRSQQTRLTLCLATVMLVAAAIAGAVSYRTAFHEVNELQDDQLRQMSALAERRHGGARVGLQDLDNTVVDVGARIVVQLLRDGAWGEVEGGRAPLLLAPDLPDGIQTLYLEGMHWRLFIRSLPGGERIAVIQSTAVRDEVAHNAGKTTIVPIAMLIPLLTLAIMLSVRHMLAPVTQLAAELDRRGENQLAALDGTKVPSEIQPFIADINRLLQRAEQALTQQRRFVADAAHELRTPLTAVSLQAELLASLALQLAPAIQHRLAVLQRGITRARHLVSQLLLLARLQGRMPSTPETVSLHLLCQQVLEDLLPLAEHKNIALSASVRPDDIFCASPNDVSAVLRNLLDNAIRYSGEGGQVALVANRCGAEWSLQVEDDGPGIPEAERQRVLTPFYRGAQAGASGSGLGLAIVDNVVQRLGGTLALAPALPDGRGLLVSIRWPLSREHTAAPRQPPGSAPHRAVPFSAPSVPL